MSAGTPLGSSSSLAIRGRKGSTSIHAATIYAAKVDCPGLTGSRILNGTHKLHVQLEEELSKFLNKQACIVFTTGYQANLGLVSAMVKKDNILIMDRGDHINMMFPALLNETLYQKRQSEAPLLQ